MTMREILFRGKRKDNGEWWYGLPCRTLNKEGEDILNIQCWERDEKGVTGIHEPVIPETIGQYTGLLDKNGKKIFEGDIVKKSWIYHYYVGNERKEKINTFIGQIVFYKGRYEMKEQGEIIGISHDGEWIEVIGNIHDNPLLL